MELIIAGSRHLQVTPEFIKGLLNFFEIPKNKVSLIRNGVAEGIDSCAKVFAQTYGIPTKDHPYKSELGKAGGPVRNREMAEAVAHSEEGGALVLIWDGNSKGSLNMKGEARRVGLPVFEIILHQPTQAERKMLGIYKPPHVRKSQVLKSNVNIRPEMMM